MTAAETGVGIVFCLRCGSHLVSFDVGFWMWLLVEAVAGDCGGDVYLYVRACLNVGLDM